MKNKCSELSKWWSDCEGDPLILGLTSNVNEGLRKGQKLLKKQSRQDVRLGARWSQALQAVMPVRTFLWVLAVRGPVHTSWETSWLVTTTAAEDV